MNRRRGPAISIGVLILFAAFARGAHDLWAATAVYLAVSGLFLALLFNSARGPSLLRLPLLGPVLAVAAAVGLSFHFAANSADAFLSAMDYLFSLLLFYAAVNALVPEESCDALLFMIVPCLWIEFAETIRQLSMTYTSEKMGTLVNANLLAAFTLPWAVLFSAKTMNEWNGGQGRRVVWAAGAVAALGCLAQARSGAAWICFLFGMTALLARFPVPRLLKPVARHWRAAAGVAAIAAAWIVFDKFTRVYDLPNRDSSDRFFWWRSAWLMFQDHPLFGVGPGNFPSAYLAYKVGGKENTLYAHSVPLSWLAETGAAGFSALMIFLAAWLREVRAGWRSGEVRREYVPAVLAVFLFYTVSIGPEYLVNLLSLAVLMAAAVAPMQGREVRVRPIVVVAAAGAALAAVPYLAAPFLAGRARVDGEAHLAAKEWDKARRSFENAIAMDPRPWEPYAALARISFEGGDAAGAAAFQRRAVERNRLDARLKARLAVYLASGTRAP